MRTLWADGVASFHGEFTRFEEVRVNPKPVRDRRIPVVGGSNGDEALGRVATFADGWYSFNLAAATASDRVAALADACRRRGRDVGGRTPAAWLDASPSARLRQVAAVSTGQPVVDQRHD
jgi:alkanesulfonate monooxygenase SsuD/methylene tetrahydromethanopterin reductase-like flavin-dependent oxidoreductase (luciferase family)